MQLILNVRNAVIGTVLVVGAYSVDDAAANRVSIRKYTPEPIGKDELKEILTLAGKAPSPFNVQPWRFLVATAQELKERLQAACYNQPQVGGAADGKRRPSPGASLRGNASPFTS